MTSRELYEQLAHGNAIRVMTTKLTGAGLLRAQPEIKRLRWLRAVGGLLAALGLAALATGAVEGAATAWLVAILCGVVLATCRLASRHRHATARGHEILRRRRGERHELRSNPTGADSALAMALFGTGRRGEET